MIDFIRDDDGNPITSTFYELSDMSSATSSNEHQPKRGVSVAIGALTLALLISLKTLLTDSVENVRLRNAEAYHTALGELFSDSRRVNLDREELRIRIQFLEAQYLTGNGKVRYAALDEFDAYKEYLNRL